MPIWAQNIIVLALILGCGTVVIWQMARTLVGRRSHVGQCCARGCQPQSSTRGTQRVVMLPVEMLKLKK